VTHGEIERNEVVERYLLRRLPATEEAAFEEHYLGCGQCRDRLRQDRQVVGIIRETCASWTPPQPRSRLWMTRAPAWGLAAALGVVALWVSGLLPPLIRGPRPQPVQIAEVQLPVVELTAFRAANDEGKAKAGLQPFLLRLDLRGVPAAAAYQVEVARESGETAWSGTAAGIEGERVEARVTQALTPGLYWVRLSTQDRLLREYSLRVAP